MLWSPKNNDNEFYVGRMARIYYKEREYKDKQIIKEFVEGELIYIKKSLNIKDSYSVQIMNGETRHTITSNLIGGVYIKLFEIGEEVRNLKNMPHECCDIINEYVDEYIEI